MENTSFNNTYTKYNLSPFMKVRYGKDVGEIVASKELPNDKVVVKFDHFKRDDFVNDTRIISANELTPLTNDKSDDEVFPRKKFSSDHAADDRTPRNKREAREQATMTEIIRQKRALR